MNLFGKKKASAKPANVNNSIGVLRDAMTQLEKREQHLERQCEESLKNARVKSKAGDKRGAIFQLKRKKMLEKEVAQIWGKRNNLEVQILALESAAGNKHLMDAMKQGRNALKTVMTEADVDSVDEVMDDINESIGLVDEMNEAMGQTIGPAQDEDDLMAELEEMEALDMEEKMLAAPETAAAGPDLSELDGLDVPSAKPKAKEEESEAEREARELRELEASMGLA